jgi:hypothetical protein
VGGRGVRISNDGVGDGRPLRPRPDNVGLRFEEFETSSGDYAPRVYIAADGVEFLASRRRDGSQAEYGEGPDGATGRAAQRRRR